MIGMRKNLPRDGQNGPESMPIALTAEAQAVLESLPSRERLRISRYLHEMLTGIGLRAARKIPGENRWVGRVPNGTRIVFSRMEDMPHDILQVHAITLPAARPPSPRRAGRKPRCAEQSRMALDILRRHHRHEPLTITAAIRLLAEAHGISVSYSNLRNAMQVAGLEWTQSPRKKRRHTVNGVPTPRRGDMPDRAAGDAPAPR